MPPRPDQPLASHAGGGRHAYTAEENDEVAEPAGGGDLDHRRPAASAWDRFIGAVTDHIPPTLRGARWQLSRRSAASVVSGLVLAVAATVLVAGRDAPEMITAGAVTVTTAPTSTDQPGAAGPGAPTTAPAVVVVHVAGLVARPGVVELPIGSRVIDAIEAAGGALPGVDTSALNLARVLVDGEQVAVGIPAAPDAAGDPANGGGLPGAPLDLNTATESDLDALPGIGPVLAARIVAWREEHGGFTAVEELLEVSGIGTATLADLSGLVRV